MMALETYDKRSLAWGSQLSASNIYLKPGKLYSSFYFYYFLNVFINKIVLKCNFCRLPTINTDLDEFQMWTHSSNQPLD